MRVRHYPNFCAFLSMSIFLCLLLNGCMSSPTSTKREASGADSKMQLSEKAISDGEATKKWQYTKHWRVELEDGNSARELRHPEGMADSSKADMGPELRLIRDQNNNIYFAVAYWQRTHRVFTLPITLYFYDRPDSNTPLFSINWKDGTVTGCKNAVVNIGPHKISVGPKLFDIAEWVSGPNWPEGSTSGC